MDGTGLRGPVRRAEVAVVTDGGSRLLCWGSDDSGQLGRGLITDAAIGGRSSGPDRDAIATDPTSASFFLADSSEQRVWQFSDAGHFVRLHRSFGFQPGAIGVAEVPGGSGARRSMLYVVDASGASTAPGTVHRYDVAAMAAAGSYDPAEDERVVPPTWTCQCSTTAMAVDPETGAVVLVFAGVAGPTTSTGPYAPFAKLVRVAADLSVSVGPAPVDLVDAFPGVAAVTDLAVGTDRTGAPIVYTLQEPTAAGDWRIGVWDIGRDGLALRATFPVDPLVRGTQDGTYDGACPAESVTAPRTVDGTLVRERHRGVYDVGGIGPAGDGDVGVITEYGYTVQKQVFEPGDDPVTDPGAWVDQGEVSTARPQDACVNVFAAGSQGAYGRFVASLRGATGDGTSLGEAPSDLAATPDGRLLVADQQHERVQQFSKTDGTASPRWRGAEFTAIPFASPVVAQVLDNEASAVLEVGAADAHTCVATVEGGLPGPVLCWGSDAAGQLDVQDRQPWVPFRDPALTDARTSFPVVATDPGASGADIAAGTVDVGGATTCTSDATADGPGSTVVCWGDDSLGQAGDPGSRRGAIVATSRRHTLLDTGGIGTCIAVEAAAVECWGADEVEVQGLVSSSVTSLSVGGRHACAVVDRTAQCWGENGWGQTGPGGAGDAAPVPVPLVPRVTATAPEGLGTRSRCGSRTSPAISRTVISPSPTRTGTACRWR